MMRCERDRPAMPLRFVPPPSANQAASTQCDPTNVPDRTSEFVLDWPRTKKKLKPRSKVDTRRRSARKEKTGENDLSVSSKFRVAGTQRSRHRSAPESGCVRRSRPKSTPDEVRQSLPKLSLIA